MEMKRAIFLLVLVACRAPHVEIQRVDVPVVVPCPAPPPLQRPALPIASLPPRPTHDALVKALAASIAVLQGYARELEAVIDGYRTRP